MACSSGRYDLSDSDRSSEDETSEKFGEYDEVVEARLSQQHSVANHMLVSLDPSAEAASVHNYEPYTGMTFSSLDDARDFYYEYAKCAGFTIRTNRIRHSLKNMAIIGRDFVCSREGFRAAKHTLRKDRVLPPRPITREGCKAMIRLAARDGSKWVVTKFVGEHNHKLLTPCTFPGELPIVNILSEEEKDKKIKDLYDELQRERERSASFREQLHMILKDLEEHADYMSIRVEDMINSLKEVELDHL